jgi:hypothetical protein
MFYLAFGIGMFDFNLDSVWELSASQLVNLFIFAVLYLACIVIVVIVLVRLLMAMLTATFNTIRAQAVLEWRLQLARHVLRAELVWRQLLGPTNAGEMDANGKVRAAGADPSPADGLTARPPVCSKHYVMPTVAVRGALLFRHSTCTSSHGTSRMSYARRARSARVLPGRSA